MRGTEEVRTSMTSSLIADVFVSADGFAKGLHSPGYFGYPGPELQEWIAREQRVPERALMGRRTYDVLAGLPDEAKDTGYRAMTARPTTVFSRSLASTAWPGARIESGDLVNVVRDLKTVSRVRLRTVGSLSVVRQLLDARLVDRLRLMVFPLFVGPSGAEPAFVGLHEGELDLVGHSTLDGRIVLTEYRPTGRPIP